LQPTTHLSTPKGWKAESAWLADLQRTGYPHKWSPVERRTAKVRLSETDVLPLCPATNCIRLMNLLFKQLSHDCCHLWVKLLAIGKEISCRESDSSDGLIEPSIDSFTDRFISGYATTSRHPAEHNIMFAGFTRSLAVVFQNFIDEFILHCHSDCQQIERVRINDYFLIFWQLQGSRIPNM